MVLIVFNRTSLYALAIDLQMNKLQAPIESNRTLDVKPRIGDDTDKAKIWKLADIVDSSHLKALKLPDPLTTGKVSPFNECI